MYIQVTENGIQPYAKHNLYIDYPEISFPEELTSEILAQFKIFYVETLDPPEHDIRSERLEPVYEEIDDRWVMTYKIVSKSEEEILQDFQEKANQVRATRDRLLAETDFYALSDNVMSIEMAEYRKELRNISLQRGFPYDVVWPVKPDK